ncbi:hypothetical protein CSB20_00745 [bacterium DOLZORAL124_64_63]|nr:MAG: hypothetical protein CSB20_00745 [bacterium DOLZORAL124_64_63]
MLDDAAARRVYALDSSHMQLGRPWVVALPATAEQARAVVALCAEHAIPLVCRGSGTGLSGGALPPDGAVVLGTGRLRAVHGLDPDRRFIEVQPGILNEEVSRRAAAAGLHFAPDPSSQSAASIGGNIAENAGGPHCLRYGVTLRHVRRLDWVDARGRARTTGRGLAVERGLDLVSLLCGSEGTLGVITAARLNLVPNPAQAMTLLALFPQLDDATEAVVRLLSAGLLPVAVEMVDQAMLGAVEEAFRFGFPTDVQGAMILELSGREAEVLEDGERARRILREAGAREVRAARDDAERQELWKCRKKAFGAVGRLTPSYVTMDVVVPLGRLPELVRRIQEIKTEHGVDISTAFHAGDGNLHPGVHYDDRDPASARRAHAAADAIIRAALALDGSVTGEHGVGIEKRHALPWQWGAEVARLSRGIKEAFDPAGVLNPGKLLPDPKAEFAPPKPVPTAVRFRWDSLTVTAPAATSLARLQEEARRRGLTLPVGAHRPAAEGTLGLGAATTVGDLVRHLVPGPGVLAQGTARDFLLELWGRTRGGRLFHCGAPVFKNVAGFGLPQALCGAGDAYGQPLAATFQLQPLSQDVLFLRARCREPGQTPLPALVRDLLAALPRSQESPATLLWDGRSGELEILQGGRDRPWDLQRAAARYRSLLGAAQEGEHGIVPVDELASLLTPASGPAWAWASPDWTLLQACAPDAPLHPPAERWIWQSAPEVFWVPDPAPRIGEGWHADPLFVAGSFTPAPEPAPGVPRDLLNRLQDIFAAEGADDG